MNVREYFNSIYKDRKNAETKLNVTDVRKLMDQTEYEKVEMPEGIKIARMVEWCMEHIGYDNFVICQNKMYFGDSGEVVKFKLMCDLDKLRARRRR